MLHNIVAFFIAVVLPIALPIGMAWGGFYLFYKLFLQPAGEQAEKSKSI
jgi:hypothetical protein